MSYPRTNIAQLPFSNKQEIINTLYRVGYQPGVITRPQLQMQDTNIIETFIDIFRGDDDDDTPIIYDAYSKIESYGSAIGYNFQPLITGATSVLTYARARQTGVSKGVFGAALAYYGYSAYNIYNTQTDEPSSTALTLTTCPNPLYEPDDVFKAAPPEPKPKLVTELKLIKPEPSKIEPNKIDGFPLLLGTLIILLAANAK